MKKFLLNIVILVSLGLLVATIFLWIGAILSENGTYYISLKDDFHFGIMVSNDNWLIGTLDFFNDKDGPYRGSIVGLGSSETQPATSGFGPWMGVYYRNILWEDGQRVWTFTAFCWYPIIIFGFLPVFRLILWKRKIAKKRNSNTQQ